MPLPVLTTAQMRRWEKQTWASGQTESHVIQSVGRAAAARALQLTRPGDTILLLAGKGHNGDDVRAMASNLAGRTVELLNVADPATLLPEADRLLRRQPALVVDGLFGIGLNRPLDTGWTALIERINGSGCGVLAIDVPSGLDADTGRACGTVVNAALTLTVGAPKLGLLQACAWPCVGRLEVLEDVGLTPWNEPTPMQWSTIEDFQRFPPRRPVASHKSSFGHLSVLAGSPGYHGAAVLAARAAQRAQPGLITLHALETVYQVVASQLQAVMVAPWRPGGALAGPWTAILIGPGLAAPDLPVKVVELARELWLEAQVPVVADASALAWLPPSTTPPPGPRVITPHPGEAARMLGTSARAVQDDRPGALCRLSTTYGHAWIILKGHQTLVGRDEGAVVVNSTGNPYLAQGGSGDVLAGFVAGLLAQPDLQSDLARVAAFAVWEHGAAADRLQARRPGWVIEDLAAEIGCPLLAG